MSSTLHCNTAWCADSNFCEAKTDMQVLLGEVDESKDPPAALQLVSEDAIRQARKAEREQEQMKKSMATRFDFLEFD